jgi:hypothetical protein
VTEGPKFLEEFIAKAGRPVPLGRMGRAQEFANIACFPVPDASYATGCAINVDGRRSSVVQRARCSALPEHGKAPSSLSALWMRLVGHIMASAAAYSLL